MAAALWMAACDVGPSDPSHGGAGGSSGTAGGSSGTAGGSGNGGGSSSAFSCSQLKNKYELTATNKVTGLCEPNAKVPVEVTASGCSLMFAAKLPSATLSGTCTVDGNSGACSTTVSLGSMSYPASFQFAAGGESGTASFGPSGMACSYTIGPLKAVGKVCHCTTSVGTVSCTNAPECGTGETCTQEDESSGAYCSPPTSACTGDFEAKTVNGIPLCVFKLKRGACVHSAQCDSCASGTPGVVYGAGCFNGQCRMKCSGTGGAGCGCMAGTPAGGNGVSYCAAATCQ